MRVLQAADGTEDDAVVDAVSLAGLLQSQKNIRAGFQTDCDHAAQFALSHFHVKAHTLPFFPVNI